MREKKLFRREREGSYGRTKKNNIGRTPDYE
jgi:hypothetical protein